MNQDTAKLLEECDSGCRMAADSIGQVEPYAQEESMKNILDSYRQQHEQLEKKCEWLLEVGHEPKKEPPAMASTFSWVTTEAKLAMRKDDHQIARLMMDGCNMGIQKISEYQNDYTNASPEAVNVAKQLVKLEEDFMQEMKAYM